MPVVDCGIQAPPQLLWVRSLKDYNPNPFTVSMQLNNTGDREARNARFKIEYDKKDLTLVAPVNNVQNGTPERGSRGDLGSAVGRDGEAPPDGRFGVDLHRRGVRQPRLGGCCLKVWVPPADAVLACTVTAPEIKADRVNQKYVPMPFDDGDGGE
ncbi:MAG: hypothetical protein IPP94_12825 [Ignavibacteria bacterium]|nr:hypothetical protein [Ignavibacteria bacterium]